MYVHKEGIQGLGYTVVYVYNKVNVSLNEIEC